MRKSTKNWHKWIYILVPVHASYLERIDEDTDKELDDKKGAYNHEGNVVETDYGVDVDDRSQVSGLGVHPGKHCILPVVLRGQHKHGKSGVSDPVVRYRTPCARARAKDFRQNMMWDLKPIWNGGCGVVMHELLTGPLPCEVCLWINPDAVSAVKHEKVRAVAGRVTNQLHYHDTKDKEGAQRDCDSVQDRDYGPGDCAQDDSKAF